MVRNQVLNWMIICIFSSQKTECALLMTRMLWTSPICQPWKETGGYSKDRTVVKVDPKTGAWDLMRKYQTSNKKDPPRDRSMSDADQSQSQSDLVNFSAPIWNFFHSYPCQHGRFIKVDDDNWINNTTFCAGKDSKCEKDEAGNDKYYDTLPKIYIPGRVTTLNRILLAFYLLSRIVEKSIYCFYSIMGALRLAQLERKFQDLNKSQK